MSRRRTNRTPRTPAHAGLIALLLTWLRRFGDTTGATSVEHVLIMSVALTGAAGFKELGTKLQHQLEGEAAHIEGKGMPRGGDLTSLAASFDAPELSCPGTVCSTPALSSPLDGAGNPLAGAATPSAPAAATGGKPPPPPPPPKLTPAQENKKSDCETRLAASPQQYFPLDPKSKVKRARPADRSEAIARLCTEMVCQCPSHKSDEQCLKQWECIYGYVAQHPTSRYFDNAGVASTDECPTGSNGHNDSIQAQCLDKQLTRWACEKPARTGNVGPGKPELTTASIPASSINTTPKNRDPDISKAAGDDAARIFQAANFSGYYCEEADGPNVFDMVCVDGDKVILIEAKGGGSDLGKRKNAAGTDYVQQGTRDYAYAIAAAMPPSTGGLNVAQKVRDALDAGTLRYFKVQQPFDKFGVAVTPQVKEFDLADPDTVCPNCKCTTP
jgi:hypothetical protein